MEFENELVKSGNESTIGRSCESGKRRKRCQLDVETNDNNRQPMMKCGCLDELRRSQNLWKQHNVKLIHTHEKLVEEIVEVVQIISQKHL